MDLKRHHSLLKEENLFLAAYVLWLIPELLNLTCWRYCLPLGTAGAYLKNTAYVLLCIKFVLKKNYTKRDAAGCLMILLCCFLAEHSVYNKHIIPLAIFLYFGSDVDYRKILKVTFCLQACIMLITITASQIGILEDVIWYEGDRARRSLGYDYCGYPAHLMLFMTMTWFCIRKRIRIVEGVFWMGLNFVIYVLTDSRTDFYLSLLGTAGAFVWPKWSSASWIEKIQTWVMKYAFVIIAMVMFALHILYGTESPFMVRLNIWLNNRLYLGYQAIETYGFRPFGAKIRWFGQGSLKVDPSRTYNYVDCAFLKETLSFGIVFLLLLCVGFYILGKRLAKEKETMLEWAVLITLIYAAVNAHLCVLAFQPFILLLGKGFEDTKPTPKRSFVAALRELLPGWLTAQNRGAARVLVCLMAFFVSGNMQQKGIIYMANYSEMNVCILGALLMLLSALCVEREETGNKVKTYKYVWLRRTVICFLAFCMISDFIVDKKMSYMGFAMLVFGTLLCKAWEHMEHPEELYREVTVAFELWFGIGVLLRVIHAAVPEVAIPNMFMDRKIFGIAAVLALAVFLSQLEWSVRGMINGAGVIAALIVLCRIKKISLLITAAIVLIIFGGIGVFGLNWSDKKRKRTIVFFDIAACIAGFVLLWYIFKYMDWRTVLSEKRQICAAYLQNLNLLGHKHLARCGEKERWVPNSAVLNLYRYGMFAGISYILLLGEYMVAAFQTMMDKKMLWYILTGTVCIAVMMLESVEMMFVQTVWLVFWFGICGLFTAEKDQTRKQPGK